MEKPHILIIDDDPYLLKTLADILRGNGYETMTAIDGAEGFARLGERPVNLVLIDLGLPDISGIDILNYVKIQYPGTDAIILTGNATLDAAIDATNQGAFCFMLKPYDIDQLLLQIRRALENQEARAERARRSSELEKINADLQVLYGLSRAIIEMNDMDRLLEEILRNLTEMETFGLERKGIIFLVDDNHLRIVSSIGIAENELDSCSGLHLGECLCGLAAATGEIIISQNSSTDPRHTRTNQLAEPHAHVVIPLQTAKNVAGVLCLFLQEGSEVSAEACNLLRTIGSQVGTAIENAMLYEATKADSLHDPLTGLANRRFMQIQLEKQLDQANRYGLPFSVVMIDIDHFKLFNDTHGHVAGDRLLVKLAGILSREIRNADYVFRYGGEEFLVIMPETELTSACEAAERLRKVVEDEAGVTVSLGVAPCPSPLEEGEILITMADAALYRAKEGGRNRVEVSQ